MIRVHELRVDAGVVVFDKDGTLLQIDPLWTDLVRDWLTGIIRRVDRPDLLGELRSAIAVADDGRLVPNGIAHAGTRQPFTLTAKPFETPLGTVGKDNEFIDGLVSHRGGERLLMGEFAHKREHSIEFQTLFLRYVMADRPIRIVPILCGSFYPYLITETPPTDDQQIAEFISTLR